MQKRCEKEIQDWRLGREQPRLKPNRPPPGSLVPVSLLASRPPLFVPVDAAARLTPPTPDSASVRSSLPLPKSRPSWATAAAASVTFTPRALARALSLSISSSLRRLGGLPQPPPYARSRALRRSIRRRRAPTRYSHTPSLQRLLCETEFSNSFSFSKLSSQTLTSSYLAI